MRALRRHPSSAASASNHARNIVIFGSADVALGQTIQYVLDVLKETSMGRTSRPLMRSKAASAVRASAMPWPSMAASISMLARFKTGPRRTGLATPAASNHLDQFFQSSRRSSGNLGKSEARLIRLRPATSLGAQTGKSCSEQRRTPSSPSQLPSPCRTARSTSSRAKST